MAVRKEKTVEDQVVAFAEQLGRLIGTVESKTEEWIDRKALNDQLTQIRDGATELLNNLGGAISSGRSATRPRKKQAAAGKASAGRSGGTVDAPGKSHRKMAQGSRGAKHSDERISKIKASKILRRPQRRG